MKTVGVDLEEIKRLSEKSQNGDFLKLTIFAPTPEMLSFRTASKLLRDSSLSLVGAEV